MHLVLLALVLIWLVVLAPIEVLLAVCGAILVMTVIVKVVADIVVGQRTTLGEAFKAVAWSSALALLASLALSSFGAFTRLHDLRELSAASAAGGFLVLLAAQALGFKIGIGATLPASLTVAVVSSTASTALLAAVIAWMGR